MTSLAIIGGTGLTSLDGLEIQERRKLITPYGSPSSALLFGDYHGQSVVFLPRHGGDHSVPPHRINYRANISALQQIGVKKIIAVAAVGGISEHLAPGCLAVPDQIIDYTYRREQSFYSDDFSPDKHFDFTYPYDASLRLALLHAAERLGLSMIDGGTYGTTQGPRLETAAEIKRLAQDGCTMVGMTGMPEAYLARELSIAYATCALSVNWAAGLSDDLITMEQIEQTLAGGMGQVKRLLAELIQQQ